MAKKQLSKLSMPSKKASDMEAEEAMFDLGLEEGAPAEAGMEEPMMSEEEMASLEGEPAAASAELELVSDEDLLDEVKRRGLKLEEAMEVGEEEMEAKEEGTEAEEASEEE